MEGTLLVGVAFSFVTAVVYGLVGRRVGSRALSGDDRLANQMFAAWWLSLGGLTGVGGLTNLAAAFSYTNLTFHIIFTTVAILVLCAALWALGFYLIYLFTGSRGSIYPLAIFYLGYFAYITYLVWQAHPIGVEVGRWGATLANEHDLAGSGSLMFLLLLLAPQVIGGIAYFSLFFRVDDRSQRYRIAMIAGSIVVWFGSSIFASIAGVTQTDTWEVASNLISLGAAIVVFAAFQPPGWVQRRYGIEPVALVLTPLMVLRGRDQARATARVRPTLARLHHAASAAGVRAGVI